MAKLVSEERQSGFKSKTVVLQRSNDPQRSGPKPHAQPNRTAGGEMSVSLNPLLLDLNLLLF